MFSLLFFSGSPDDRWCQAPDRSSVTLVRSSSSDQLNPLTSDRPINAPDRSKFDRSKCNSHSILKSDEYSANSPADVSVISNYGRYSRFVSKIPDRSSDSSQFNTPANSLYSKPSVNCRLKIDSRYYTILSTVDEIDKPTDEVPQQFDRLQSDESFSSARIQENSCRNESSDNSCASFVRYASDEFPADASRCVRKHSWLHLTVLALFSVFLLFARTDGQSRTDLPRHLEFLRPQGRAIDTKTYCE